MVHLECASTYIRYNNRTKEYLRLHTRYIIYSQDYCIYWTITDSLFSCTNYMIYTVSVVPDGPVREIDVALSYECCTKVEDFRDAVVEIWVLWRRKNIVQLLNIAQLDNVVWPRYVERGRWVRCWLGGQLLFFWSDFSVVRERKRASCRVSLWGDDSRSYNAPGLIPTSPIPRGNTRIPYSWNVPLITRILYRKFQWCRILKILSNILCPIEYSYGSTEVSKIYPTFSISYSIYSTSQVVAPEGLTRHKLGIGRAIEWFGRHWVLCSFRSFIISLLYF